MYKNIIGAVLGFLLVFVMAYLLGTSILTLIDHKMTDISINMPKINLPKPILNVYLDPNTKKITPETSWSTVHDKNIASVSPSYIANGEGQKGGSLAYVPKEMTSFQRNVHSKKIANNVEIKNDSDIERRITQLIEAFDILNKTSSTSQNGGGASDGKLSSTPNPKLNNKENDTYYIHPSQMSPSQLSKFKTKAQFSKMTLQDYQNWLSTHQDFELTNTVHADNYHKYKKGQLAMSDLINLE